MILAAGLLVLVGLGMFVAGLATGVTAFFWGCVAVCVVAAVLLVVVRRQMTAVRPDAGWDPQAAVPAGTVVAAASVPPSATEAARPEIPGGDGRTAEPPVEEVEVTDLLLIVDLDDEVLVVDEHPRYHLPGCPHLAGREAIPLPLDEARTDGFTPCAGCAPDRHLAERVRGRRRQEG